LFKDEEPIKYQSVNLQKILCKKWKIRCKEGENMKPQRTQREIMFKNSVNSLVFANQEAVPSN